MRNVLVSPWCRLLIRRDLRVGVVIRSRRFEREKEEKQENE
jgi:hypothetical protein